LHSIAKFYVIFCIQLQEMIKRSLQVQIENWLFRKKVIVIYGARQVGKTTLVNSILAKHPEKSAYFNCEIQSVKNALEEQEPLTLKRYIGDKQLVVFDEAQYIRHIGRVLKILIDTYPDLQIIATGSSSFELANRTSEPLTGRSINFTLYPLSYKELEGIYSPLERRGQLDFHLRYGLYPEIANASEEDARMLLDDLSSKYLYKDILAFENLKHSNLLHKLLQLLALQIGGEVSYHELANALRIDSRTVERYIDLLEKAFVIFRLPPFSRNLRKEISKRHKVYFYDIGIRNSIVQQYQPMELRTDKGAVWENFLIVERLKLLQAKQIRPNRYFWRTHDQQEIDYLEESGGKIRGFEIKWKKPGRHKVPKTFTKAYPEGEVSFIDQSNFEDFILE